MLQASSIIEKLKLAITDAETQLRESAANDIRYGRESSQNYEDSLKAIKIIAKLNDVLKENQIKTESFMINYSIKSNLKGKRLTSVIIDNESYPAKYLRDVSRIVFEWLCSEYEEEVMNHIDEFKGGSNNEPFASTDKNSFSHQNVYEVTTKTGITVYIDPYRMTINNMCALRNVLKAVGVSMDRISICIDESYQRQTKAFSISEPISSDPAC